MLNNNLKYCREELEMTQEELGYVFGVSKYTVHGWENAHDTMPFNKLIKFCNLYNYSIDFVLGLSREDIKYDKITATKESIGNNLKKNRLKLKLTQQQLADDCNISQTTYSGYETGQYLINTITIYTICKKYHLSIDELLNRKKI